MLDELMNIRGVRGAALVDAGGAVLGSAGDPLDTSVVTSGRAVAGSLVSALGSGELRDMVIDFESGPVLLTSLGERTLMTAFDDVANLGRVRFGLKKVLPSLSA